MKRILKEVLLPVSVLILSGVVIFERWLPHHASVPTPAPAVPAVPAVDGVRLGRSYAPILLSTYSEAWLAAAQTLEEGKSVAEAQQALQDTWKAARVKAFTENAAPGFALVLPEGAEPTSPERRAKVVEFWRAFARGLNEGR